MSRTSLVLFAVASVLASAPDLARAHGVSAEVDERGGAVAVRVRYHDGPPLAGARYEVESPRGGNAPFAQGRTDRHGWLVFTPDASGTWRVRVADASGHGKTVDVPVAKASLAAAPQAAPTGPPLSPKDGTAAGVVAQGAAKVRSDGQDELGLPRVLVGAAAIVALFGVVFVVQRARRDKGR